MTKGLGTIESVGKKAKKGCANFAVKTIPVKGIKKQIKQIGKKSL